jgi:inorganic pyrophosphatase
LNLWKDIKTKPSLKTVHAVIETLKGSKNKYEYNVDKEVFVLERVLHSPFQYPTDYGMIPRTMGNDGNPLDIMVMMHQPTFPGCIIECRPIGVMKMTDEGERDDKILGVPVNDPRFTDINDIQDVPLAFLEEIEHFFREYKKLEGKITEILGWKNTGKALEAIDHSIELYNEMLSLKTLFQLK